jgi:hypothetical protein
MNDDRHLAASLKLLELKYRYMPYLTVVLTQIGYILDYPHGLHLAA